MNVNVDRSLEMPESEYFPELQAKSESPAAEASDQEVVAWAREGDEDAYREMVRRYGPPVFDLIYRMLGQRELAEDLTQETFVKAFSALGRHGPERKPSAWSREQGGWVESVYLLHQGRIHCHRDSPLERLSNQQRAPERAARRKATEGDEEQPLVKVDPEPEAIREARRRWSELRCLHSMMVASAMTRRQWQRS